MRIFLGASRICRHQSLLDAVRQWGYIYICIYIYMMIEPRIVIFIYWYDKWLYTHLPTITDEFLPGRPDLWLFRTSPVFGRPFSDVGEVYDPLVLVCWFFYAPFVWWSHIDIPQFVFNVHTQKFSLLGASRCIQTWHCSLDDAPMNWYGGSWNVGTPKSSSILQDFPS